MRRGGFLLALVLVLSGCSAAPEAAGTAAPSSPAAASPAAASGSAVDLVGTAWKVAGRSGTTVRFDGLAVTVATGGASSAYAWSAQGDQVLFGAATSSLSGAVAAPWLTAATRVARTADGWSLLDASGATTARLTPDGGGSAATATTLLTTATPGDGVVDAPATALTGTWVLSADLRTSITFGTETWRASSSCTSGSIGGGGVYRVLAGGRLLVTRTMTPIRGCPIVDGPRTTGPNAITAITRAGSFRVRGRTLTLFDRSGASLGQLTRA